MSDSITASMGFFVDYNGVEGQAQDVAAAIEGANSIVQTAEAAQTSASASATAAAASASAAAASASAASSAATTASSAATSATSADTDAQTQATNASSSASAANTSATNAASSATAAATSATNAASSATAAANSDTDAQTQATNAANSATAAANSATAAANSASSITGDVTTCNTDATNASNSASAAATSATNAAASASAAATSDSDAQTQATNAANSATAAAGSASTASTQATNAANSATAAASSASSAATDAANALSYNNALSTFAGWPTPNGANELVSVNSAGNAFVLVAPPSASSMGRNFFDNSSFRVWQRGPLTPASTGNNPIADRWFINLQASGDSIGECSMTNIYQGGNVALVGKPQINTNLQINSVTGGSGASNGIFLGHRIPDIFKLAGQTVTVSLWVAQASADTGKKVGVQVLQNFGVSGTGTPGTITSQSWTTLAETGDGFTRYTATFTVPYPPGYNDIADQGTDYTEIRFWLSAGSTNNTVAGSIGVQSWSALYLAGAQCEIGSAATTYEYRRPEDDLRACLPYCQQIISQFAAVASAASQTFTQSVPLMLPMRRNGTPTISSASYTGFKGPTAASSNVGTITTTPIYTSPFSNVGLSTLEQAYAIVVSAPSSASGAVSWTQSYIVANDL